MTRIEGVEGKQACCSRIRDVRASHASGAATGQPEIERLVPLGFTETTLNDAHISKEQDTSAILTSKSGE